MINIRSRSRAWLARIAFGGILLTALAGCGPRTATVSGRVTFHGEPLAGGSVILFCPNEQIVRGVIAPDGSYSIPNVPSGLVRFTVKTHSPIPPGFKLSQELPASTGTPILPDHPQAQQAFKTIPERYGLPEESGLFVNVDRTRINYDIVLQP